MKDIEIHMTINRELRKEGDKYRPYVFNFIFLTGNIKHVLISEADYEDSIRRCVEWVSKSRASVVRIYRNGEIEKIIRYSSIAADEAKRVQVLKDFIEEVDQRTSALEASGKVFYGGRMIDREEAWIERRMSDIEDGMAGDDDF
jgi:hypothetical protein